MSHEAEAKGGFGADRLFMEGSAVFSETRITRFIGNESVSSESNDGLYQDCRR